MDTNIACELLDEHRYFDGAAPLVDVEGMSTPRVCRFLNRLVSRMAPGERYLEVGTWKGRTLLSAALGNSDRVCIGCDKFRFWGRHTGPGFLARRALYDNLKRYRHLSARIEFHPVPARELFHDGHVRGPIGVYFYDGDHSYGGTHHGIVAASAHLAERSVLLVDDWNDPVIRRATSDAIAGAQLTALWSIELPGDHGPHGWWNGLGAFYLEKKAGALRAPPAPVA